MLPELTIIFLIYARGDGVLRQVTELHADLIHSRYIAAEGVSHTICHTSLKQLKEEKVQSCNLKSIPK